MNTLRFQQQFGPKSDRLPRISSSGSQNNFTELYAVCPGQKNAGGLEVKSCGHGPTVQCIGHCLWYMHHSMTGNVLTIHSSKVSTVSNHKVQAMTFFEGRCCARRKLSQVFWSYRFTHVFYWLPFLVVCDGIVYEKRWTRNSYEIDIRI